MDLMIDLETLGTHTKAPIISIGAQFFDLEKGTLGESFYANLDIKDQIDTKVRFADASTLKWWMGQDGAAKKVFKDDAHATKEVLWAFATWILQTGGASKGAKATKKVNVWGNGSSFDITLMETLFADYGIPCPWLYYNVMDMRTFKRFVANGAKVVVDGVAHNALDDAKAQAEYCLKYYKEAKNDK